MLASFLGSCPGCVATPESDFFWEFFYQSFYTQMNPESLRRFLNGNYRFRQWKISTEEIDFSGEELTPQGYGRIMEKVAAGYAYSHAGYASEDFTWVDHTPSNILHFNKLNKWFPESKFLFIMRDPRAVYTSVKDLDWGANTALRFGAIWMEYTATFLAVRELFPDRILMVRYEDIVVDPAVQVKGICDFCGLAFTPEILEGKGFKLPGYTADQHRLVGNRPVAENIDKWKHRLSERDLLLIETVCGTVMGAFGYQRLMPDSYSIGRKDRIQSFVRESYYYFLNKFRKRKREWSNWE